MSPRRINPISRTVEKETTKPTLAAETVVATIEGVNPDSNTPTVLLEASCGYAQGATATTVVTRVRRGSLTGAVVGKAQITQVPASASGSINIQTLDSFSAEQAGLVYVLTTESPSATSNPEVTGATLTATY